jgi:hypothetical protein
MNKGTCPICEKIIMIYPRYPMAVCEECASDTYTVNMEPISFYNEGPGGGFFSMMNGIRGDSHDCFIHGIKCYADEARMGGIVISRLSSSDSQQAIFESKDLDLTKDLPA